MEVTLERVDHWMVKGFEGCSSSALTLSSGSLRLDESQIGMLDSTIRNLEDCIRCTIPGAEKPVEVLFCSLLHLSALLKKRCFEMGIKTLSDTEKERLQDYAQRLKIASMRFKERSL